MGGATLFDLTSYILPAVFFVSISFLMIEARRTGHLRRAWPMLLVACVVLDILWALASDYPPLRVYHLILAASSVLVWLVVRPDKHVRGPER